MSSSGSEDGSEQPEAGPSVIRPSPPILASTVSPLDFDIIGACRNIVHELNIYREEQALAMGLPEEFVTIAFTPTPRTGRFPSRKPKQIPGTDVLYSLAKVLAMPQFSEAAIKHLDPLLLDLLAIWLDISPDMTPEQWEGPFSVVASLSTIRPDLWRYVLEFIQISPFRSSPLSLLPLNDLSAVDPFRIHSLLLAYTRLLTADPDIAARNNWPLESLHVLQKHQDAGVRFLAVQCLSKQRRWSETKRMEVERDCVGDINTTEVPIFYEYECDFLEELRLDMEALVSVRSLRKKVIDGWLLPSFEAQRIDRFRKHRREITNTRHLEHRYITESHIIPRVAFVAGSLLLRASYPTPKAHPLVHVQTNSSTAALRDIVSRLPLGDPMLITSPPSSGKTHILHYLSSELFPDQQPTNRILTIPLADTTIDVKSLLGTYVSSPTKPGTFEWMEGALAKAVRAGRWVVFDDIDRASIEMLVTIEGLARSLKRGRAGRRARLAVPGRDEIEAGEDFALFATRTVRQDAISAPTFLGHHDFQEIRLVAPSDEDILAILSASFPQLPQSITTVLVDSWQQLRSPAKAGTQAKGRDIGLRDLEKWCARVQHSLPSKATLAHLEQNPAGALANPVFQDEILLEASDTFMAALDAKESSVGRRAAMIREVAQRIGMDEERAFALLDSRRPHLELSTSKQLRIGRAATPIYPSPRRRPVSDGRPFALTKPSLVLLERITATIAMGEPALLVGETGTGKTTAVQHIASLCHRPLTVLNLSTQTESSDLLGGFKPIDASVSARVLHTKWQKLFTETFSMAKTQNGAYLEAASKALSGRKWGRLAELWSSSAKRAVEKLVKRDESEHSTGTNGQSGSPRKRRKISSKVTQAALEWQSLLVDIADFDLHHVKMKSKLVFSFVEGPLVKALRDGEWILLDEVNLASQETLEAISTLLEGTAASLVLTERGDVEPIPRHPDFRLFACMNPATDVGKKDLPPNLRARFTELYVPPPDDDLEALTTIVAQYLGDAAAGDKAVIFDVVEMYSTLKRLSAAKEIVDGSNTAPHYSMRTLARALMFAVQTAPLFGLRRGLWEGCLMAFTMSLDVESSKKAHELCTKHILLPLKNARAVLSQIPSLPTSADPDDYVRFGPFWLKRGPLAPAPESRYVITPSVQSKLSDLARVILTHRYPVLIQGPTSAGKTSAVEFLARQTGHKFVRINNHEHTDIQEYLGTYVTDPQSGNLVFQEGLLVTAVRQGHWIVLDELNLAPTDVLEALNRLLDDNRELVIPETQEVIKPHPNFILFATQNPPGLYAGRKVLSRAFRNRFLEVHFDDVPKDELETILCQRCRIAPSYAKKIVQVFEELRHRRQASRVFESKSSFATLRDLFRWAERGAIGYQQLAEDGYMLLAERARQAEDKVVIKQVIEEIMKVTVDEKGMYRLFEDASASAMTRLPFDAVPKATMVWTNAMQRLFVLVASALAHNEPVLLVGETGCGKTSICEVVALAFKQALVGVNCHQNMETADLLGSQRPVRNRHERRAKVIGTLSGFTTVVPEATDDDLLLICHGLLQASKIDAITNKALSQEIKALSALFEWADGPLVHAMHNGDLLLLDEVSLADDSVLERLNSVLEPGRTLVLAEKGGTDIDEATLVANDKFHVVATMNPGGDFGKKELSPALRNRFTEIWVPPLDDRDDLLQIIGQSWKQPNLISCGPLILDFFKWFGDRVGDTAGLGLRDILAWVNFSDQIVSRGLLVVPQAFHHGGQMVLIDGLESLPQVSGMSSASVATMRSDCLQTLSTLASSLPGSEETKISSTPELTINPETIAIGGFGVKRGSLISENIRFRLDAPTTARNAMRVLRGCQLPKAILLEGSPGVGKTSLVSALASLAGHHLQRINLSDQTDLIDLFGSDLPVEGGQAGEFQWRDAAFLDAMQKGDWVLLDEMNLASQTVLEGLNAVLDHRGTVYIPELGRSFDRHPNFRVFAAQNPLQQGGGRKGLPKSFLNRFTKVYLQEHTPEDLMIICKELHPMAIETVQKMITFNEAIRSATMVTRTIGVEGSPWEFNLRDLFRWFSLLSSPNGLEISSDPVEHLRLVYLHRFRNERDRLAVANLFREVFNVEIPDTRPVPFLTSRFLQIGHAIVSRSPSGSSSVDEFVPHTQLDIAESVLKCIEMGWLVILAGSCGIGKRDLVRSIASAAGRPIGEFAMHPGVDTSEILGSFEQQDFGRLIDVAHKSVLRLIDEASDLNPGVAEHRQELLVALHTCIKSKDTENVSRFLFLAQRVVDVVSPSLNVDAAVSSLKALKKAGPESTGFAWVDGQLLDAIRNGGWFLISNANLCSASVLDRLNSLCEANGVLVMSEKGSETGSPEVIKPHADFRLFMTYDPRYGELSRAMRNRGVELHVDLLSTEGEEVQIQPPLDGIPGSIAMAEHSVARNVYHQGADLMSTTASASVVANSIALQSVQAGSYIRRLLQNSDTTAGYVMPFVQTVEVVNHLRAVADKMAVKKYLPAECASALPFDASVNPHISETTISGFFRLLQAYLRNREQVEQIEQYLEAPSNAKSILSLSRNASLRGTSRNVLRGGNEIYPFASTLRENLSKTMAYDCLHGTDVDIPRVQSLEQVLVLLAILEKRAMDETFDWSSTQLLAAWLQDILTGIPALEPGLIHLRDLVSSVSITRGQGQSAVWSLFRPEYPDSLSTDLKATINNVQDTQLRKSILQALVAHRIQYSSASDELNTIINSLPPNATGDQVVSPRWQNWSTLWAIELFVLSRGQPVAPQNAIELLISDGNNHSTDVIDLGVISSGNAGPGHFFSALSAWLARLWSHPDGDIDTLQGPATLFSSSSLQSVLRFGVSGKTSMAEIPQQEAALKFTVDSTLWQAKEKPQARYEVLKLVLASLTMILSVFGFSQIEELQAPNDLAQSISSFVGSGSVDVWLKESFDKNLKTPLSAVSDSPEDLNVLGDLCIALSHFLLSIYVTNIPIDPAVRRILLGDIVASQINLVEEELRAVEQGEKTLNGAIESRRTADVRQRLQALVAEEATLPPSSTRTTDAAELIVLFNEVHAFLDDAMSQTQTEQLTQALQDGNKQALQREDGLQAITGSFVHRLKVNYGDWDDLIQPIITAILFAKFGFRCLARDLELRNAAPSPTIISVLSFPSSTGYHHTSGQSTRGVLAQILETSSITRELDSEVQRTSHLQAFVSRLDNLYSTWSDVRLREQQEAQEADSLYRVKKTDVEVLSDQEQEEKEFAELFPTFDGETEEDAQLINKDSDDEPAPDEAKSFSQNRILAFHRIFTSAFVSKPDYSNETYTESVDEILHSSFDSTAYDENLDEKALAFRIRQLHKSQNGKRTAPTQPNFYLSPNEPEIRKACVILERLSSRLVILIREWPEQMVLQHLRDRVERVLALDMRSSVAQILSAMEQLLVHTDDWESYANRDNSLKSFQGEISDLIVSWRRLELSSWMRLLDDQAEQYIDKDSEWTLRLYGALIHGAIHAKDADEHIKSILPLLNTYLNTSTFGHYASRLSTLAGLEKMATELAASSPTHKDVLDHISRMLHNILGHARLFEVRISESLHIQRAILDKAIKDFVKLASWKDVNVFALKASAIKSHRQLHRNIRKFRLLLQQPVSPIIADLNSLCPQDAPQASMPVIMALPTLEPPSITAVSARNEVNIPANHLVKLDATFTRYQDVLRTGLRKDGAPTIGVDLDSMAVEIIETVAMLQKATPSSLTKENEKVINNLASRKRKAFADLLKALRASGFSNNLRADLTERQQSSTWLAERPSLLISGLPEVIDSSTVKRVEGYHHKLQVLMVALRLAFNGHNPDINSQDLQRGIGFVESVYATALGVRDALSSHLRRLSSLTAIVQRLKHVAMSVQIGGGQTLRDRLIAAELDFRRLHSALKEVEEGIHCFRELEGVAVKQEDLTAVHELRQESALLVEALCLVNAGSGSVALYTDGELKLLHQAATIRQRFIDLLTSHAARTPELSHLYGPVAQMAVSISIVLPSSSHADTPSDIWKSSDGIIQKLLVVAQQLKTENTKPTEDDERIHIPSEIKAQQALLASLRISSINDDLTAFMTTLSNTLGSGVSATAPHILSRILPFLEALTNLYATRLADQVYDIKSTYKLCYVVGRVMLDLAQKGYCKPQEEDNSKGGADETVDGTGLGSGTGDKNVSNEIEEEGQVEGLQGEKEEEKEEGGDDKDDDEDDAVSMEEDFEGELGEGKEKEGDDNDSDADEEEDHDEHVGDVDPLDPGAVDEKFWGEESEKEKEEGGREDLMNEKNQEENGETELSAKDDKNQPESKGKEKEDKEDAKENGEEGEQGKENQPEQGEVEGQDEMEEEGDDQEMEQEGDDGDERDEGLPAHQDEVALPEGDKLDLPEDLNFDDDDDEGMDHEGDDFNDDEPMKGEDGEEGEEGEEGDNDDAEMASNDDGEVVDDAPPAMEPTEEESNEPEATLNQNLDLSASNDSQAQEAAEQGQGQGGNQEKKQKEEGSEDVEMSAEQNEEADAQPPGQGSAPKEAQGGPSAEQEADGPVDSSGAPLPANTQGQAQPNRSLGDIMKDIRRRRDEILAQQERDQQSSQPDAPQEAPGQVEYLKEEDQGDDQALGPAGEEERQKLADLNILEETDEATNDNRPAMQDEDDDDDMDGQKTPSAREADTTIKTEQSDESRRSEKALTQADIGGNGSSDRPEEEMEVDDLKGEVEAKRESDDDNVDDEAIDLGEVATSDLAMADGEATWRQYAALTGDLSYALCEQLRLILEPTLATRLQGDFRTGKRLNMRKIIPYIASEYTKDKIWLRRTKPSRREYQVLLSLDDSRSMADSHSVHLAYQTLALVSQALNKLEVGQVAIAKFGQSVDILHPFGNGFSETDGAKVMGSFKFDQHRTDVVALVERTLSFLAEARQSQASSSSAPDLWQLQIIISDGICQDHNRLRQLLRKALEERVMIVFIVIDSLHTSPATTSSQANTPSSRPSILSMQTVEYKSINGEMQLEMTRYLDTFPFEFFVVLRDVEALPGVLSDTLRQWMTRVSQSQE